ncbi:MAG: serine hydrolase [Solirubrobacterales bacterium]
MGRSRLMIAAFLAIVAVAATVMLGDGGGTAPATAGGADAPTAGAVLASAPSRPYPSRAQIRDAKRFARGRAGSVSFAVIGPHRDSTALHGRTARIQYSSASLSKAMLLAGYLRAHKRLSRAANGELKAMITLSDNHAADAIYAAVGDQGLCKVARRAGMRDFEPTPGFWGGAHITAADMARFFYRLEDNLGRRHRRYGLKLFAGVVSYERWGIPAGAGRGWSVWFKGGWRPGGGENSSGAVSHQAALLRYRDGTRVAIAVLTDQAPREDAGYSTIEGIATRLLNPPPGGHASGG